MIERIWYILLLFANYNTSLMAFSYSGHLKGQTFAQSTVSATCLPSSSAYWSLISQDSWFSSSYMGSAYHIFFLGQNMCLVTKIPVPSILQRAVSKLFIFTMNLSIVPLGWRQSSVESQYKGKSTIKSRIVNLYCSITFLSRTFHYTSFMNYGYSSDPANQSILKNQLVHIYEPRDLDMAINLSHW